MHYSWSLFHTWIIQIYPLLIFSTQFSIPWNYGVSSSRSDAGSHMRAHRGTYIRHRKPLTFGCNKSPRTSPLGDDWLFNILTASGLLPWLGSWRECELVQHHIHHNSKSRSWTKMHIKRMLKLERPYINSIISGISQYMIEQIIKPLLQLVVVIHQSSFVNKRSLYLPPILSLTTTIIPSLDHVSPELISTSMVSHDNQVVSNLKTEDAVTEPKTGFKFPLFLSCNGMPDGGLCSGLQELAGVGSRSVNFIRLRSIKIYAFGFYVRPDCLRAELGKKYSNLSDKELEHKSCFFDDLLRHEIEMTVRLVVHYKGLKVSSVRSAFEASLKNRLKKIKGVDEDEGLHMFCSYFKEGLTLSKGTVIDFHRGSGGKFLTQIDGHLVGTISSHDFCRAFFDLYIGDPPVSLKTKHEIGQRLGAMLRSR